MSLKNSQSYHGPYPENTSLLVNWGSLRNKLFLVIQNLSRSTVVSSFLSSDGADFCGVNIGKISFYHKN